MDYLNGDTANEKFQLVKARIMKILFITCSAVKSVDEIGKGFVPRFLETSLVRSAIMNACATGR